MNIEKKTIQKEDGRTLHYYHFPQTATESQTEAFRAVDPDRTDGGQGAKAVSGTDADAKETAPNV